jgi:Domain of Unknown Function (DUF1080)
MTRPLPGYLTSTSVLFLISTLPCWVWAQPPAPSLNLTNRACDTGPILVGGKPDTLTEAPDAEGFYTLFNGKNLKGWWENCGSNHSSADRNQGGIWVADSAQGILYASQNPNGAGSLLSTNASLGNYELVFEIWPTFGNDAGIFNRCTANGKTWQSGLDYIRNSSIGGSYSENGWSTTTVNEDPYKFGDTFSNPTVVSWTTFTSDKNPTTFGCSAGGCTASDFTKVWNTNGWNQIRIKFYGGLTQGGSVTMETWMRKVQSPEVAWVPLYKATKAIVTPPGPLAIQIHGGTDMWKAGAINAYRQIKYRPLDDAGNPLKPVGVESRRRAPKTALRSQSGMSPASGLFLQEKGLRDAQGRRLNAGARPKSSTSTALGMGH